MVSDIEERTKGFMLQCIEDAKKIDREPTTTMYHHCLITRLIGKVFMLEEQIKELRNE